MRLCIELFDYCGEHFKIKFLDNKFQVNKSGNIFSFHYTFCCYKLAAFKNIVTLYNNVLCVKGILHPRMKILSSFTHPHVIPNP